MILQQSDLIIDDMRKERDALRAQVSVSNQCNCLCCVVFWEGAVGLSSVIKIKIPAQRSYLHVMLI